MPVILPERQYNHRLKLQLDDAVKLQVLLKPYPAEELTAYTETRAALKSRP